MSRDKEGVNPTVVYIIVAIAALAIVALVGLGMYFTVVRQRSATISLDPNRSVGVNILTGQPVDDDAWIEDAKISRVKIDVETLASRAEQYKLNFDRYPRTLKELTEPHKDVNWKPIPDDRVIDPWGKPYQIDPTGKRNGGEKADIYTTTPGGKVIGNFPSP